MSDPKYPDIEVELSGRDGNAFMIIGRVMRALRFGNVPQSEIDAFRLEASSGSYDHVLQTVMKWVSAS